MLAKIINRLRNGYLVYHFSVSFPNIGFCTAILDVLWKDNFIRGYKKNLDGTITVFLKYHDGVPICSRLVVLSRPRNRLYLSALDLSRISNNFGVLIISTTKGVMKADDAVRAGQGGEILAYVV